MGKDRRLKRRYADRRGWRRVLRRRFYLSHLNTPEFTGDVALFCLDAVREPLRVKLEERWLCIADAGHSWLQHFSADEPHHTVTTMFDAQGQIVQWYIDVCKEHGVSEQGIPWLDDLYLDIVIVPSSGPVLLDADELEGALRSGDITQADHDLAWQEAKRLVAQIERRELRLLDLCTAHREMLLRTSPL
jgi:predicted RNA-binding protein associated with RNAse of E/G family